jgi:hypothetical protein
MLEGNTPDQVPWFGDLDYWATALVARREKPEGFIRSEDYLQWHRDLGVGFYLQGYYPFVATHRNCEAGEWKEGNRRYREIRTPAGNLRECWEYLPDSFSEAPVEYLVKSEKDLPALRSWYESTCYEKSYEFASLRRSQLEEIGVSVCYFPKSPFMQLLTQDAGIVSLTFIERRAPEEISETLKCMKTSLDRAAHIAVESPAEILMIPENLSSDMVGPAYFEKYMRHHQEEWIRNISSAGKFSMIHMDGTLKGLLRQEASTGVTILEALTPEPAGDLPVEEWESWADNPRTILWGGIPGIYFTSMVDEEEFDRHVKHTISVMRTSPRYVLGVADQIPPDGLEERVRKVRTLVDEYGTYRS